jgi:ubiquinol-cytochrome c reductase cytochrome b subunit
MICLQFATGLGMTFYYSPSATTAWESVSYIQERVLLGAVLRGLHAFGASAVVILLALHVLSGGLARAYRRPREAAWLSGLVVAPVLLGFALTGYLLPWDQKGYWATQVAVGIARGTPLIGHLAGQVLQGGAEIGTLTLTRFYSLHTILLPATLTALALVHVRLVRRAATATGAAPATPWWPTQAGRDALVVVLVVGAVALLAVFRGAGLEAPADPTSTYPPRPEWYFSPLRQLLKTVPEPWGSLFVPGLVGALLVSLPWLDRAERPRRGVALAVLLVPLAAALTLGLRAYQADAGDLQYQAAREEAEAEAHLARELARGGIPPGGAADLLWLYPPRRGQRLFQVHCEGCHTLDGKGGGDGPDLRGYGTRAWLEGVLRAPRDPRFFGHTKLDGMTPLSGDDLKQAPALVAFLRAQDPALAPKIPAAQVKAGEDAYFALECNGCHGIDPGEVGSAPNLRGYGSAEWLGAFLRAPGHELFYGEDNDMPAYAKELDADELSAVVTFLRGQDPERAKPAE